MPALGQPASGSTARAAACSGSARAAAAVRVSAPGRLHLGFLDPSGTLGRRFGSLGMIMEGTSTIVRVAFAPAPVFRSVASACHEMDRAQRIVGELQSSTGLHDPLDVFLESALPPHVGLGSGTQLALALGRAFVELHGIRISTPALASLLGRGGRSGIGIAGFDVGGVLVDGGPRQGADAPPVLARFDFPESWRVLLTLDSSRWGLHGETETQGIARLPLFSREQAAGLCHLVLMQILPALAEREFVPFARGLTEVQRIVGEYFAPAQGGVFTSPPVGRLMHWISRHHQAAVGQSSWGPTAFAIFSSQGEAQRAIESAKAAGVIEAGLDLRIVAGRNHGAEIGHEDGAAGLLD